MKINKLLSAYNQSSRYGSAPAWIVMHWVSEVSSARNNCLYFKGGNRNAGAHLFVDGKGIWQSIPLSRSAWHCGGGLQDGGTSLIDGVKGARVHDVCRNQNSIGIELCCIKKNGKIIVDPDAISNAVPLVRWLMNKYGIPADHVIRHWDVTGKECPGGYLHKKSWAKLHKKLTGSGKVYGGSVKVPAYPTEDIASGDTGAQVKSLQKCMNKIIDAGLKVDGSYGDKTVAAVKKYQKKKKLSVDGSCGPKTRAAIKADVK